MENENNGMSIQRLEWVDVFKGIMITLVVIGHATGYFNSWIYQFHMAAFFFISGYLSSIEKQNCLVLALKKVFTIFLPLFTLSLAGFLINYIINRLGYYDFLFGSSFIGLRESIAELLRGNIYVQYLGTFWFLATLFGIELLQITLYLLVGKRLNVLYFTLAIVLFFVGYWCVSCSNVLKLGVFDLDLICIGQGYYNMGLLLRKAHIEERIEGGKRIGSIVILCIAIVISLWGKMNSITVDYPSRRFEHPFAEFVVALSSIYVICFFSRIIANRFRVVRRITSELGRNSLGIMSFHFAFFKIFMVFLYCRGAATAEQISYVVLPPELQIAKYWVPMTIFSIVGSLMLWDCFRLIPGLRFLVGQDAMRNKKICELLGNCALVKRLSSIYEERVKKLWNDLDGVIRSNPILSSAMLAIGILFAIPMYRTGIIINDELQARCLSMQGFETFYKTEFMAWISQGRLLAAPINSFTKWLSFIGACYGTSFRIGSILILIGVVLAFGVFVYRLFKNRGFAIFSAVFSMACMPIAFEHTPPNAFVGFIAFSFLLVLISGTVYVNYIENGKTKYACVSMLLFFVAMMSYEAFITFMPLYLFIAMGKTGIKNLRKNIRVYLIPTLTSVVFLALYVISGSIALSGYEGNQLGFDSLLEPLRIIANLFVTSIPGFYVVFPRYQYFKELYFNLNATDYLRIGLFVALFAVIAFIAINKLNKNNEGRKNSDKVNNIFALACGLCYMVIPSIPNSVASMYQGVVGFRGSFLALPVTFMEYFAASFVMCYAVWLLIAHVEKRFYAIIISIICLLVANVQEMNDVFSKEQNKDFNRLVQIESFLKTDTVKSLEAGKYYASDLYKQQNLLAIHNDYWSGYCNNVLGLQIQLSKERDGVEIGNIYYDDDNFVVVDLGSVVVVSKDKEEKRKAVQVDDDNYIIVDFASSDAVFTTDNEFFVYSFPPNSTTYSNVGYKPVSGYYADGWLESESEFYVITGEQGKLNVELCYPGGKVDSKSVKIYFDDELVEEVVLKEEHTPISLSLGANLSGTLRIQCDFDYGERDDSDIRPLAILLSKMDVE